MSNHVSMSQDNGTNQAKPGTPKKSVSAKNIQVKPNGKRQSSQPVPTRYALLEAIWRSPDKVHQFTVRDRNTGQFRNEPIHDIHEHVRRLSKKNCDLYFACAEFKSQNNRTAENAAGAWALWLDIDCSEDKAAAGQGYASIHEARKQLGNFCRKAGIPRPNVLVNSGNGLHAYWILDRFIEKDQWQKSAKKLKQLTQELGFLADPSRTADIASVLRVPGTLNYKYNPPKPVVIIHFDNKLIEVA